MLPFYELVINDTDETGVDFNAFVLKPAHSKPYFAFNKNNAVAYHFNEEKRIVTGVMMSANTPIFRSEPDRYVLFSPDTIYKIRNKFHKNGFDNNVNIEHNSNDIVNGVRMVSSYIISNPAQIPVKLQSFNIQNGSWIASYKIDNPAIWRRVKNGEFSGYSVEGYFNDKAVNLKTNKK